MQKNVDKVRETAKDLNLGAQVAVTDSVATVDDADFIKVKKVVLSGMDLH